MSNEGYDSDNNQGDKPKDGKHIYTPSHLIWPFYLTFIEFQFFATVFKVEEKKIVSHPRWEQVTAVYW